MPRLEFALSLPRTQKLLAYGGGLLLLVMAALGARADWRRGLRGTALWVPFALRSGYALVLMQLVLKTDAKVLVVEAGRMTITSRLRQPFGGSHFTLPIREAALEWIDGRLTLQSPESGLPLALGNQPSARVTAAWLVAQGAPPPVGG